MMWCDRVVPVLEVQQLAMAAGFGCVVHLTELEAGKHSYYCSKYVGKSVGDRDDVPWVADVVDEDTGEVRRLRTRATYRTWSRSASWGVSMAAVREAVRQWARERAAALSEGGAGDQVASVGGDAAAAVEELGSVSDP